MARRTGTFALVALLGIASGCGHDHSATATVTVEHVAGDSLPFRLTLINQTNQTLVPGPIDARPYTLSYPTITIPPGGTASIEIGYLPSKITVGATGVGNGPTYVYPTSTLYLDIDYFEDSPGATFIYRG